MPDDQRTSIADPVVAVTTAVISMTTGLAALAGGLVVASVMPSRKLALVVLFGVAALVTLVGVKVADQGVWWIIRRWHPSVDDDVLR